MNQVYNRLYHMDYAGLLECNAVAKRFITLVNRLSTETPGVDVVGRGPLSPDDRQYDCIIDFVAAAAESVAR